jgi:anti-sigma regulatory factor (Ser/Thr protein kinase)
MAKALISAREAMEIQVADSFDCAAAQLSARKLACKLGFASTASEEIALAAGELASNLVKHAGRGVLTFKSIQRGGSGGIELESTDHGPGIPDIEKSFTDGYSTQGSLGYGLGTVNRLMDEIEISSMPDSGTHIVCRRWLRETQKESTIRVWGVGIATRSRHFAAENGDAFVVIEDHSDLLVGLIDGLGHGKPAQTAALTAQQYVQRHYGSPLDDIFRGVSRACRTTRGVVMALARFSAGKMSFASVGNVEARVYGRPGSFPFVFNRGIVGAVNLHVSVQEYLWDPKWLFILHTDGLRTHWQWDDFPGLSLDPAQVIAARLLRELASDNDDATALAVKHEPR